MKNKTVVILIAFILSTFLFTSCMQDTSGGLNPTVSATIFGSSSTAAATQEAAVTEETTAQEITTDGSLNNITRENTAQATASPVPSATSAPTPTITASQTPIPEPSGVLSNFQSTDINGSNVDRSVFKDKKLTMINIWATFCSPCINEMPDLALINREYSFKGFQVIGIPIDVMGWNGTIDSGMVDTAKYIISATGADYMHILPSESLMLAKLGQVYSVPETIFVDQYGNQVGQSYIGSRSQQQWKEIIDRLLAQTE